LEVGDADDALAGSGGGGAASGNSSGGSPSAQGGVPDNAAGGDDAPSMAAGNFSMAAGNGGVGGNGGTPGSGGTVSGNGGEADSGGGAGGSGGTTSRSEGPCDIYAVAATPCAAAYSTIRALSKSYQGPLYQVRNNSSSMNTGTGGMTMDIGMTADGFADSAAQDNFCAGTICTFSLLYDQSGNGNHLKVAPAGSPDAGTYAAQPDFESNATAGALTVGGHAVYSLYMAQREGYRLSAAGEGMPKGSAAQGIYMLADGTHAGSQCCWEFGNVSIDPLTFHGSNTLFLGQAFWGKGAGNAPWFGADFQTGIWMGGSIAGDPGWGHIENANQAPANPNNPSMKVVKYALGFLKTSTNYALQMANLMTASTLTTAYDGPFPTGVVNDKEGAIVLGVGSDNSNSSWGTFYEGAIVAGYPAAATELAVMQNLKAVGYGQ
jgi:hypothetical protein